MESEPRSRMLQPEELVEVHSREINIDLEKEHFEEVNVQLSSSDDEDQNKHQEPKPDIIQRNIKVQSREIPTPTPESTPSQPQANTEEKKTSPIVYVTIIGIAAAFGYLFFRYMKK